MFFWSHPRCFGPLGKFQHNIKISIKTARVSRLSVSYDYGLTVQAMFLQNCYAWLENLKHKKDLKKYCFQFMIFDISENNNT